jgi:hypothetical protein
VENQREDALSREEERLKELLEMKEQADTEVSRMRESVGETKQYLEENLMDPDQALKKVQKLDDKMAVASEIRQSRNVLTLLAADLAMKDRIIKVRSAGERSEGRAKRGASEARGERSEGQAKRGNSNELALPNDRRRQASGAGRAGGAERSGRGAG